MVRNLGLVVAASLFGLGGAGLLATAYSDSDQESRLGGALTDIASVEGSELVLAEGPLLGANELTSRGGNAPCIAYWTQVLAVQVTRDSEGHDRETTSTVFEETRGPKELRIKATGGVVGVPLGYWTSRFGHWEVKQHRLPRWKGVAFKLPTNGEATDYYLLRERALRSGDVMFAAGSPVRWWTEPVPRAEQPPPQAEQTPRAGQKLVPGVSLAPHPVGGVELFPGTRQTRLDQVGGNTVWAWLFGVILVGLGGAIGAALVWRGVRRAAALRDRLRKEPPIPVARVIERDDS